jgi:FKBP-type peptidyl-prolyl cis-trans isomerase
MKKLPVILATSAFVYIASSGLVFADDAKAPAAAPVPAAKTTKPAKAATPAANPAAASAFQTEEQKVSYAIGLNIANNLNQMKQQMGFSVDANLVELGIKDAMSGGQLKMSKDEIITTMQAFGQKMQAKQKEMQAAQEAEMKKAGDKNTADGKAYLDANGKKEGVVTTKSGLQYKIITAGKGPKPKATDTVSVNYRGTLIDGKEFDSSYKRGEPASFAVNSVIPGWTEVLQLMPEGSKWEVTIPSDLAYGPGGAGGDIGPNSTLVFEIELLKASGGDAGNSTDAGKK